MNTPNPLVPQGSLNNQSAKGKSSIKLAVVSIIAVHVVFFGGLLLQGCKRDTKAPETAAASTNSVPLTLPPETNTTAVYGGPTNPPADPGATAAAAPAPAPAATTIAPPEPSPAAAQASTEGKEYTVAKGDSLFKIAKANGVTVAALTKANPKVDPSKLKVGQKITVPAPVTAAAAAAAGAGTPGGATGATAENGAGVHVVKRGDTLTKVAHQHGVTVKAIRAANGLKTDRLTVDQKLKIPAGKGAETAKSAAPAAGTQTNQ